MAVRAVLKRRGMKIDSRCCMCGRQEEDGAHLMLKCKEVKELWRELHLEGIRLELIKECSPIQMMTKIMDLPVEKQITVVTLLWLWWNERNRWREEKQRRSGRILAYAVAARADSLKKSAELSHGAAVSHVKKWIKPTEGTLKINVDGAFSQEIGTGGWGFVIRDEYGVVRAAGVGSEEALQSAFHAELIACREGLMRIAANLGMPRVSLETDATMVKAAIEGEDYRLSSMGGIITEIKILKALEFVSCEFLYCPRICNKLAHELAAMGCKLPGGTSATWDSVPQSIEGVASSDSAVTEE